MRFDSIGKVKDEPNLGQRLKVLLAADDRAGQLVRAITYQGLAYACQRIPEIADTPKAIDDAMRWGFGREAGPFETWDMLGVAETIPAMTAAGFPPHPWVEEMLAGGCPTFYQYAGDTLVGVYNPALHAYEPIPRPAGLVLLNEQKTAGKLVKKNLGASLVDLGDGVACVEFHTKMNTLDADILGMLNEALDCADPRF